MAIQWFDVVAVCPRLSTAPAGTQTALLNMVNSVLISDEIWGDAALANLGRQYLAAHLGTLAFNAGGGAVTDETVGQLSRSYATPLGLKGSLGLTSYGAEYTRLTRLLPTVLGAVY